MHVVLWCGCSILAAERLDSSAVDIVQLVALNVGKYIYFSAMMGGNALILNDFGEDFL